MPELRWVGKDKVVTHHLDVPYRVLEQKYTFTENGMQDGDTASENMVIHGDNLEALKALLPQYEARVDCIYIDPPYNTGEEGWVYNDNVNDPRIHKWLGEVVGSEGKDLSRHDKWLCMMYPRLRLLHRLLAPTGTIFVSIDDNELSSLGAIMDEIFGGTNKLACAPVRSEASGGKEKSALRTGHEYLLVYTKGDRSALVKQQLVTAVLDKTDKWGPYRRDRELRKWGSNSDRADRPSMWFALHAPDGTEVWPIKNDGTEGRWRWGDKNDGMIRILNDPEAAHWELSPYDPGVVVNGQTERWVPYEKARDSSREFGWNTWLDGYGTNADGTAVVKDIFGSKAFDTPKPVSLIEWIVGLQGTRDAVVLDSFAGSGTTAQAVLNLNKLDGQDRKFILVELMDYANSVTAERVKRTITGYKNETSETKILFDQKLTASALQKGPELFAEAQGISDAAQGKYTKVSKPKIVTKVKGKTGSSFLQVVAEQEHEGDVSGTGGSFSYYELGVPLMVDGDLNPDAPLDRIREYIWLMETRSSRVPEPSEKWPYFLGRNGQTAFHFMFEPHQATTLDYAYVAQLTSDTTAETTVIYADACFISPADLSSKNIVFKKIPRDITRL